MKNNRKKHYLSIMGTMGSGKTTAVKLLANHLKFHLLEENFGTNAFLPKFYQDMERWAFHSQAFFLLEKVSQILGIPKLLSSRSVVQDTLLQQDVFSYAKAQHVLGHMDDDEWRLYQKIYRSFEPYFPRPDLLIYLETSLTVLRDRIKSRARTYEQSIPNKYLELLDDLNHKWLSENKTIPVIIVKTDGINIVRNKKAQTEFVVLIKKRLKYG
ncbi:MAG: deoxynucleoside kinase [uncultured bacterium]|nr:MAG: deoxynucleoside kinase [uncultured bacterium]HCM37758.1 hypothetical protein [Patescibacteria group bacterium]